MNYLYSLYDALVSINVPSDRARAVVDAMERDMSTTLATKEELLLLKQDVAVLRREIESRFNLLVHEIATQGLRTTLRLGSMLFVGFGLSVAAIRLWM